MSGWTTKAGRAGRVGVGVLACLTLGSCASTGIGAPRRVGIVAFANTTGTCAHPMAVAIAAGGARAVVAPGASARLELAAGETVAIVRAADGSDAELARETWTVAADAETTRFFGCAAPQFVLAAPGRMAVTVRHTPWGCRPGPAGPSRLAVDGQPFAQVAPGQVVTRLAPPGPLAVRVDSDGADVRQAVIEVGPGGGALEVGCTPADVAGPELAVLAVFGPDPACGRQHSREVTAAGVTAVLAAGEAYTFVLSPGRTRILTRDGPGAAVEALWLELAAGGTTLPGPRCAAPEGPAAE